MSDDQALELQEANTRITGLMQKFTALTQVYNQSKAGQDKTPINQSQRVKVR